jgi:hypothetical protein
MADDHAQSGGGRVIWLPLGRRKTQPHSPREEIDGASSAVADFARYEGGVGTDDYRHRMIVNVLAFLFCVFLVFAGVWIATKMAAMRKDQDCVLSGRRGCTPVEVPIRKRW